MALTNVLHTGLRWLYKSIAIVLVSLAVLISCLRLFLPYAENYREDFQTYINETYQTNIIIGQLNTGWENKGPTLVVKNVSLVNAEGLEIFIGTFEVEVDFWKSIQHQKLVTKNFIIEKAKIRIEPSQLSASNSNASDNRLLDQLYDLFLTQIPRFTINDSKLQVIVAGSPQSFSISELVWRNEAQRHQGKGEIIVNELSSNKLSLLVDLDGTEQNNLTGQAYFQAKNIDVAPWLNDFIVIDDQTNSSVSFQSWLKVENGDAEQLIVQFDENHITWQLDGNAQKLTIDQGYFVVNASDNYHYLGLHSSPIQWTIDGYDPQFFEFNAHLAYGNFSGYISQLDIESAIALTPLFIEDENTRLGLSSIGAQGNLQAIQFQYNNDLSFVSDFKDISIDYHNNIPGIQNLSGNIAYQRHKARIELQGQHGELDFGPHFKRPMPYNVMSAEAVLSFQEGVFAQVDNMYLTSDELTFTGEVAVNVPNTGKAGMSLLAHIDDGKGQFAKHYYPHLLMGDDLVNYLDRAITNGKLTQAEIIYDGAFSDFPFTENPGLFNVNARLSEATFVFDSDWPAIENLDATLDFTNNSMLITAHSGKLTGLDVIGVEVGIDDLSDEQVLTVKADIIEQQPEYVAALMNASPLASSVGEVLNTAVFSKAISGGFSLNLPLNHSDLAVAKGHIKFANNALSLTSPEMEFANLYGELYFENDVVNVDGLRLNWRGMPMTFNVAGQDHADKYLTNIHFASQWKKDLWHLEVTQPLQKYLEGDANWQADLALIIPHSGEFRYQLDLKSDVTDNDIKLPHPYKKAAQTEAALALVVKGNSNQSNITAHYQDMLSFYGDLDHEKTSFTRAHLLVGQEEMMLPVDGFHISVALESGNVNEWQPFVSDILASLPEGESNEGALFSQPERIRGTVRNVSVFDEKISNVTFNLVDKQNWWQLDVNAKELHGQLKFFPDWYEQGLDIDIDFLNLNEQAPEDVLAELTQEVDALNTENEVQPIEDTVNIIAPPINHSANQETFNNIPPIKFSCDSCRIGKLDMGEVSFTIEREQEQLVLLKNFHAKRKGLEMKLNGQWLMDENNSITQLGGNIEIGKLESEMDRLGLASIIKDSGAELKFDINWSGGAHDFNLARLNGEVHSRLDDGYLADVPDQARIFSVLSLQSLVRKLTLDFRDVFSDGMFYSQIKGDSILENGIVYTDNMKMKGSAGDLSVKGNTNMATGALDYTMTYKPNLTSSLPAIAWIATLNPVAIIAGVAIDEVFTSNVVSEYRFVLSGSIDEPNLKEVNRKTKNISVSRSTPPQEIETLPEANPASKVTPMKQYQPMIEPKDG